MNLAVRVARWGMEPSRVRTLAARSDTTARERPSHPGEAALLASGPLRCDQRRRFGRPLGDHARSVITSGGPLARRRLAAGGPRSANSARKECSSSPWASDDGSPGPWASAYFADNPKRAVTTPGAQPDSSVGRPRSSARPSGPTAAPHLVEPSHPQAVELWVRHQKPS